IGDIKPAEEELEFCMDLAWDIDAWQPEKAYEYTRHWMHKTFGEEFADELSGIKLEYYGLAAAGKPEHIFSVDYNSDEMDERIRRYENIARKVDGLSERIPARLKDAYFELVEYPVKGAYNMNVMTFRAKQSLELAGHGQREKALDYAAQAQRAHDNIEQLTEKYNKLIANGKWDGMMDCKPRKQKQFYLPAVACGDSIAPTVTELEKRWFCRIPASGYNTSNGDITEIRGLGIGKSSVAVWPIDYTDYSKDSIDNAPFVEYSVPVKKGINKIEVRCLPTFPVHAGDNLDVALGINGCEPQIYSLKTVATKGKWNQTVLQGYNDATVTYDSPSDTTVTLRVSLLSPGIAVSEIYSRADN
ncbi:MAG: glycosyl hydrolase 115 family protein, partial [Duncaniella sp.]|nr:glycosyl hydrolase 115 family protein [Duncaniella sp.]